MKEFYQGWTAPKAIAIKEKPPICKACVAAKKREKALAAKVRELTEQLGEFTSGRRNRKIDSDYAKLQSDHGKMLMKFNVSSEDAKTEIRDLQKAVEQRMLNVHPYAIKRQATANN